MKLCRSQWLFLCFALLLAPSRAGEQVAPPAGSSPVVRDRFGNQWTLAPAGNGLRKLMLLPAQAPNAWIVPTFPPGLKDAAPGEWRSIHIDDDAFLWLSGKARTLRFDLRKPESPATEAAMPAAVAEHKHWRAVARMPVSNHDLTAAVLNNRFYVSGGLTAEWGFPAHSRAFDELWELSPRKWTWRVAAKLGRERIYCATAAFDGKVWVIGGDVMEPDGSRHAVRTVELYDPRTGDVIAGPEPQIAWPMPLALTGGGRLYVMGNSQGQYDQPGMMESIGAGESAWRREPDGPAGMGPLAGAALDGKLYLAVPKTGLAAFDARSRRWDAIESPSKPRSCQMAAYRGEIWMMGGRDVADGAQTIIFNPKSRTWRNGPPFPRPLSWGAAAELNGELVVTGGATERRGTEQGPERIWVYSDATYVLRR